MEKTEPITTGFKHKSHRKSKHPELMNLTKQEYQRQVALYTKYRIRIKDYNEMFDIQNGCCLICNTHQSKLKKSLTVDHCHKTGKVRGLLCGLCNTGLGSFRDDIVFLENAIKYLKDKN